MISIVAVVFLAEQQTESCRIIISSGVLSCALDPFTGDGWRRKRAPSVRSLRWHHVFISPRHDSTEPNESFKIFIVGVTHLLYTPASRTDDARLRFQRFPGGDRVKSVSGCGSFNAEQRRRASADWFHCRYPPLKRMKPNPVAPPLNIRRVLSTYLPNYQQQVNGLSPAIWDEPLIY